MIGLSALVRFSQYGGFATLGTMSARECAIAGLWLATHLVAILSTLIVASGILVRSKRLVLFGFFAFGAVCLFAWSWPMDFLWFG
ncbi:hypothetical protein FF011L_23810 [Roseimaritima multifibrata]|uniref:Uncharacterized protein n=2 Tax=Roseimaritima multifibrata TaxID=1930274 RepID=A0A517MFE1_9BACT|nr:hypothetical protein FF011L_23810 [Roseimaritima multifibrata]